MRNSVNTVVVFLALLLLGCISPSTSEGREDAILKAAVEDAYAKFNVDKVEVINYSTSNGSYRILLALINYTPAVCPKRYHVTYLYPEQHFLTRIPELVAGKNCNPCNAPEESRKLLFPEEAIAAEYSLGLASGKPVKAWREGSVWYVVWETEEGNETVAIGVDCSLPGG